MYIHLRNLFLLSIASLVILLLCAPLDLPLGIYARDHSIHFLESFFNLSIFLDGKLGMADIVVFFVLAALAIYIVSFLPWGEKLKSLRIYCGYIFSASFAMAISIVHSIKWALSRARPYDVFPDHLHRFSDWFMPGAYTLNVGFNKGSFPSGHVATMSVLIALFFLIPVNRSWSFIRWVYLLFVAAVAMLMGWYRMMYGSHWFTDNVASLMMSVVVSYFFYHFLFFPSQETQERFPVFGGLNERRPAWAIHLVWQLLFLGFSLATIIVGLRLLLLEEKYIHGVITEFIGIVLSYLFGGITLRALFGYKRAKQKASLA